MPPPFNIDNSSPADNALVSAFPNNERSNRTLIEEWLAYISDPTTGMIRTSVLPPAGTGPIPSTTKMVFFQANAPTGWTKDVTHNNKAMRIVNGVGGGTGGTTGFTTVFQSRTPSGSNTAATQGGTIGNTQVTGTTDSTTAGGTIGNTTSTGTVGGHALTTAELPSHTHTATLGGSTNSTGDHSHTVQTRNDASGGTGEIGLTNPGATGTKSTNTTGAHSHTVTVSGTSDATGSNNAHSHSLTMNAHNHSFTGSGHTHTFTSNTHNHSFTGSSHNHTWAGDAMDFAVQYIDVIICTKD